MAEKPRILFVDDEPAIRLTLPAILQMQGFEVTAAATVPEALAIIHSKRFDVLLSDLNIGQPGDGFTVVSAMRRTQPEAVTLIITGYPAFETALQAIRSQVDDYISKPAEITKLVEAIQHALSGRKPNRPSLPLQRVPSIIRENQNAIVESWLKQVMENPEMAAIPLSKKERIDHLPWVLRELIEATESNRKEISKGAMKSARVHGKLRGKQGYSAPMLAEEVRILLAAIGADVQDNLLSVDVSQVVPDLIGAADILNLILRESLRAMLGQSEPLAA